MEGAEDQATSLQQGQCCLGGMGWAVGLVFLELVAIKGGHPHARPLFQATGSLSISPPGAPGQDTGVRLLGLSRTVSQMIFF